MLCDRMACLASRCAHDFVFHLYHRGLATSPMKATANDLSRAGPVPGASLKPSRKGCAMMTGTCIPIRLMGSNL